MPPLSTSAPKVRQATYRFHCIGCGDLSEIAGQDFRCSHCGDLLEITYPQWKEKGCNPQELKDKWRERRLSIGCGSQRGLAISRSAARTRE